MPDTTTLGMLVAGALSLGGEAAKAAIGEAVKDAYQTLKAKVAHWAGNDVAELERAPRSEARKAVIAETIDALPLDDQDELHRLTQALTEKLRGAGEAIGLDIGQLDAAQVELGKITVTSGTGARIRDANVSGTFKTDEIVVGVPPGKP